MEKNDHTQGLNAEQLKALVDTLAWNDSFGCYTRSGFEKMIWPQIKEKAQWIIFCDVDDMHGLNNLHGYDGVNELIKKSLTMRASDFIAGQWFSGDEFVLCITDDPNREDSNPVNFAIRLAGIFHANGVSATFAIAPVFSIDLYTNVKPVHDLVQDAKRHGKHGTISMVPGSEHWVGRKP